MVSPFFPYHCAFQDLKTGRTIGDESESKGLHFFNSVQHTLSLIVTVVREKIGELGDKGLGLGLGSIWNVVGGSFGSINQKFSPKLRLYRVWQELHST